MSMSVGASSSSALSYLQQLLQQGTAGASNAATGSDPLSMLMQAISGDGSSPGQTSTAAASSTASASSVPPFGQDMMSELISLQSQQTGSSGTQSSAQAFFSKLDTDGDGQISQSEFENAASKVGVSTSTADAVFAKIDANSDGSVSQSELTKADHGGGHHHHHHVEGSGGGAQGSSGSGQSALDSLMSATGADGATTQSSTNADGSTTTTISYADGSKIDMTTPAASSSGSGTSGGSSSNGSSSNLLEQLIKLQSQVLSVATSTMSAFA